MREVVSREVSINVGPEQTPEIKDLVSRECSIFVENGAPDRETVSRELSVGVAAEKAPRKISGLVLTFVPTGESVTFDWSGYNQWAEGDVDHYAIYISDRTFSSVAGMTPAAAVRGETFSATVGGLAPWMDHYVAVVPVDVLGRFDAEVPPAGQVRPEETKLHVRPVRLGWNRNGNGDRRHGNRRAQVGRNRDGDPLDDVRRGRRLHRRRRSVEQEQQNRPDDAQDAADGARRPQRRDSQGNEQAP